MRTRREVVEHPFGTMKMRMGATHFLCKTLPKVATEMALCVLTYNLTRVLNIVGVEKLMEAMDFRQGIGFADRTEYLAQFSAELAYVMAVERLMGIEVPESWGGAGATRSREDRVRWTLLRPAARPRPGRRRPRRDRARRALRRWWP